MTIDYLFPNEAGGDNTLTGAFKQGISPIALSIGLISGGITDKALSAILPKNTNQDLKSSLSGGISGGVGETASMILGSGASAIRGNWFKLWFSTSSCYSIGSCWC